MLFKYKTTHYITASLIAFTVVTCGAVAVMKKKSTHSITYSAGYKFGLSASQQ